jgi:hypothetical protein
MILQRTTEWYKARIGKFTASNFSNLMAKPADKSALVSKSALNCIEKAAAQLYYNRYFERPDNDATSWGNKNEQKAIGLFSKKTNFTNKVSGFIIHPMYPSVGATPDTIVCEPDFQDDLIIAQIKCPFNSNIHLEYWSKIKDNESLKNKKSQYYWQIQGEIWVTNAIHSYFISFDPRMKDDDQLLIVKIKRDEDAINELEKKIIESVELRDSILHDFQTGKRSPKFLEDYY